LASWAAIIGGIVLPLFMMLSLFGSNQVAAIGSLAVVLGGIVSLGSNVSTLRQTIAATSAAEALRSDLISRIDLRVVGDKDNENGVDVAVNKKLRSVACASRLIHSVRVDGTSNGGSAAGRSDCAVLGVLAQARSALGPEAAILRIRPARTLTSRRRKIQVAIHDR
jgi:hypothetical protein